MFSANLPVITEDLWQIPSREPHGQGTHQNPKDCKFIKHLAQETQRCMEVDRSNSQNQLQPIKKVTKEKQTHEFNTLPKDSPFTNHYCSHQIALSLRKKKLKKLTPPRHAGFKSRNRIASRAQISKHHFTVKHTLFLSTEASWEQAVKKSQHSLTVKNSQFACGRKWKIHKYFPKQ